MVLHASLTTMRQGMVLICPSISQQKAARVGQHGSGRGLGHLLHWGLWWESRPFVFRGWDIQHASCRFARVCNHFLGRISSALSAKINTHGHDTMWCWPKRVVCHHEPTSQQWLWNCSATIQPRGISELILHTFTISPFLFKQCKQQTRQYFTSNTLLTLATQRSYHLANDSGMFPMNVDDFQRYN